MGSENQVSVMLVLGNTPVRTRVLDVLENAGCLVTSADDIEQAFCSPQLEQSTLIIIDADCCRGRYADVIEKVETVCPRSTVAFLVGWWDERIADLSVWSQQFLYRPVRPKQVQELLTEISTTGQAL